jgi:hypothetical protein
MEEIALKKIVVVDSGIESLNNNLLFDPKAATRFSHTLLPICFLAEQGQKMGMEFMTTDVFFNLKIKPENVLLISGLVTPLTQKLIMAGAKPSILICQESPFIATRFYLGLKKFSGWFKHSIVFSGMKKHLSPKTSYLQMFFPSVFEPENFQPLEFSRKKFLTMISGNKRMGSWEKTILLKLFYGFNVKEIYALRQKIINFFAQSGDFDLYGMGWDKGGVKASDSENIKKVYRGTVGEKLPTLRQYKFVFCLENSIFPGYVTEKIFDAMFAGSVPVYLGAPDVETYVPKDAFVDMRDFKNFHALEEFLRSINEEQYNGYIRSIREFFHSQKFYFFSQEYFAKEVLEILNNDKIQ